MGAVGRGFTSVQAGGNLICKPAIHWSRRLSLYNKVFYRSQPGIVGLGASDGQMVVLFFCL